MTNATYMAHYVAAKIKTKPSEKPKSSPLPILIVVAVLLCLAGRAQTTLIYTDTSKFFIGSVIDDGVSKYQGNRSDTIPVVMMVSDTTQCNMNRSLMIFQEEDTSSSTQSSYLSFRNLKEVGRLDISVPMHYQPYIIYGYQVTEYKEPNFIHVHNGNYCPDKTVTTIYLTHLKQPLPQRLFVWMAGRRQTL